MTNHLSLAELAREFGRLNDEINTGTATCWDRMRAFALNNVTVRREGEIGI